MPDLIWSGSADADTIFLETFGNLTGNIQNARIFIPGGKRDVNDVFPAAVICDGRDGPTFVKRIAADRFDLVYSRKRNLVRKAFNTETGKRIGAIVLNFERPGKKLETRNSEKSEGAVKADRAFNIINGINDKFQLVEFIFNGSIN